MNPTDLGPLLPAAAAQVASFSWSSVLPIATGALLTLLGVILTLLVNYKLKKQEFERQEAAVTRQRVYDSGTAYMKNLLEVNRLYVDYLIRSSNTLLSAGSFLEHFYDVIGDDMQNRPDRLSDPLVDYAIDAHLINDALWDDIKDGKSRNKISNLVYSDLAHVVLWQDSSLMKDYENYIMDDIEYIEKFCTINLSVASNIIKTMATEPHIYKYAFNRYEHIPSEVFKSAEEVSSHVSAAAAKIQAIKQLIKDEYDAVGKPKKKQPRLPRGRRG